MGSHELRKFRLSVYQTDQGCVRDMIIIVLAGSGVSAGGVYENPVVISHLCGTILVSYITHH